MSRRNKYIKRESEQFLTVDEFIKVLKQKCGKDKTMVVVDNAGNPILDMFHMSDDVFGGTLMLMGAKGARDVYANGLTTKRERTKAAIA